MRTTEKFTMLFVLATATCAQITLAKTITVHSTADDGPGSLRQAIAGASDGDKINIVANGTITLTSGELVVTKSLTITGPGPHGAVSGNGASRVFHITPSTAVTFDSLTIANGAVSTDPDAFPADAGGAIYSDHARLTVSNCTLSNNSAVYGGAIFNNTEGSNNGTLTVLKSTLSRNSATSGAAIYNDGEGGTASLSVTDSTVSSNSAFLGGGILNDGEFGNATTTLNNVTFDSNSADFGGGGSFNAGGGNGSATLQVTACRFSHNSAGILGGAIHNDGEFGSATAILNNSTVSDNSAGNSPPGGIFSGAGGIFNDGYSGVAILTVKNSILSHNTAAVLAPTDSIVTGTSAAAIAQNRGPTGTTVFPLTNSALGSNSGVFGGGGILKGRPPATPTFQSTNRVVRNKNSLPESNVAGVINHSSIASIADFSGQLFSTDVGGGIFNHGYFGRATSTLTNSTISGNSAGRGGGIENYGYSGTAAVILSNTAVIGNSAVLGGGIDNISAVLTLYNTAVTANSGDTGGGISSYDATTTLNGSSVENNSGGFAGGIYNLVDYGSATLTLNDSTVGDNSSDFFGGGIGNEGLGGSALCTLNNSTVSGNAARSGGGGIFNNSNFGSATLTLKNSTVSDNSTSRFGGGVENYGDEGGNSTVTVSNCTVSNNSVVEGGGGILNSGFFAGSATLTLSNSTISSNSANRGGGIETLSDEVGSNSTATLTLLNCTLSNNSAVLGNCILLFDNANSNPTLELANTILNAGASGDNILKGQAGTVTSHGYNLSSDATSGDSTTGPGGLLNAPGDIRNTNPLLGPLKNNGGLTLTHALLKNSPAINTGDPSFNPYLFNPPLVYDQRGASFPRIVGGRLDIGSFEAGSH
jgi:hypothetical protein